MYKTKQITEEQAYAKLAAFCAAAEHCESELWKKLTQWGISTSASGDIIRRLLKENYINDIRYGNCFVRDKFKYNKWGRIKIKQALVQKGLSASVIEQSLEEIDEQAYEELLLDLLKKKSGLKGYLGTADLREVETRIDAGDEKAREVFDALAYQISTQIGVCYAALCCKCDVIAITAGMSKSKRLVEAIEERVGRMAPVRCYSGDYENKALALGALRVLRGEETLSEYTGEEGYMQPVTPWKR